MIFVCKICDCEIEREFLHDYDYCPNCTNWEWMKKGERNNKQWTQDPPTQEGWYWANTRMGLYIFYLKMDVTKKLYFESVGMFWAEGMEEYKITHWLGPLPIPELPK